MQSEDIGCKMHNVTMINVPVSDQCIPHQPLEPTSVAVFESVLIMQRV